MAACTNNGGSRARRAVTAALVGVLSVGTVPMVALATGVDTTDGIETMAVDWTTGAKVTAAEDGKGVAFAGESVPTSFQAGTGKYLLPTEVENSAGVKTEIDLNTYKVVYYGSKADAQANSNVIAAIGNVSDAWGDPSSTFATKAAGTYYLVIQDADGVKSDPIAFKLTDDSEEGIYAYEGTDTSDTSFAYTGNALDLHFAKADGTTVTPTTVTYRDANGANVGNAVTNAGDYTAEVKLSATDPAIFVKFTVAPLDLSTVSLSHEDVTSGPTNISSVANRNAEVLDKLVVGGNDLSSSIYSNLKGNLKVQKVDGPDGVPYFDSAKGSYTATIVSSVTNDKNVINSGTVTFSNLTTDVFRGQYKLMYGNADATTGISISLLDGQAFDASKVRVVTADATYSGDQLELTYVNNATGAVVDASALAKQGTYTLNVRVKPVQDADGNWIGGSEDFDLKVTGSTVDANKSLAFFIDGELVSGSDSVSYDGEDWLGRVTATIKDAEGNALVEGTDYELVATKDGKEVDSIVDADSTVPYEIVVKPITFTFEELFGTANSAADYTLKLTVNPVSLTRLVADVDSMKFEALDNGFIKPSETTGSGSTSTTVDNEFYVKYTGSAVEVPAVKYEVSNATGTSFSYVTLDPSLYNVVSIKDKGGKVVKEAVEAGTYTVKIALSDEAADNYTLSSANSEFTFTIREYGHFVDVNPSAWYAQAVEQAYSQYYVNGVGGTDVFMPETQITRADAVGIIYNMAGGYASNDFSFDETGGYVTGFEDVDGHAYYARAIAWANAAGVVNGHNGQFNPTDDITRQEFAAMLANYAKATGKFVAPSADALDGIADAGSVDAWATESVAWAVENGVMGNAGYVWAGNTITRAEVAAMAVNYQPESLDGRVR